MNVSRGSVPVAMRLYSSMLHAFPCIKSGVTPLSFNPITNHLFARCSDPVTAKLLNGVEIEVAPNDHDGRVLYLFGTNDPKVQSTAHGFLREGDVFLDIGANYSTIGLSAAERVGTTGLVHLFEPQEWICRSIKTAIARARLTNVVLHNVALMEHDGEMRLSRPRNHSGAATLVDYGGNRNDWEAEAVSVRNIATYVTPLVAGRQFGAKVDVEGAEPILLPWLLSQPGFRFLIFEAAHNRAELFDLVRSVRCHIYGLCRNVFRVRLRLVSTVAAMSAHHDMVAVRIPASLTPPEHASPASLGRMVRGMKDVG